MSKQNFSVYHRLLHWSIAFVMIFLIMTIFLRLHWMNKYVMRDMIVSQLSNFDITIGQDQGMKIAKTIRGNMWQWHINAGYLLIGLYVLRLLVNLKERGLQFTSFVSSAVPFKDRFQQWVYAIFYVCLGGSLITGLCIICDIGSHELMEDLHKLSLYYLIAFVCIHMIGIVAGELTDKKNIVSEMIHGKNKVD